MKEVGKVVCVAVSELVWAKKGRRLCRLPSHYDSMGDEINPLYASKASTNRPIHPYLFADLVPVDVFNGLAIDRGTNCFAALGHCQAP